MLKGSALVTNLTNQTILVIAKYSNLQKPKPIFDMHSKNKSMMNQYHDPQLLTDINPLIHSGQIYCYLNSLNPNVGCQKGLCPGFGQDRVNFHRNPGSDTAGLTQPDQTEQGIPYHVPSYRVLVGGEMGGGKSLCRGSGARR